MSLNFMCFMYTSDFKYLHVPGTVQIGVKIVYFFQPYNLSHVLIALIE